MLLGPTREGDVDTQISRGPAPLRRQSFLVSDRRTPRAFHPLGPTVWANPNEREGLLASPHRGLQCLACREALDLLSPLRLKYRHVRPRRVGTRIVLDAHVDRDPTNVNGAVLGDHVLRYVRGLRLPYSRVMTSW